MSGKLIADLQNQVRDLTRYIEALESGVETAEVTLRIGKDRVSWQANYEEWGQLLEAFGELMLQLGCDRSGWADLLDLELSSQLYILKTR